MATKVTAIPANGSWVEVTGGSAPTGAFRMANTGRMSVLLQFVTAAPGANATGERLEAGQTIETGVLSRVFARKDPAGTADAGEVQTYTAG